MKIKCTLNRGGVKYGKMKIEPGRRNVKESGRKEDKINVMERWENENFRQGGEKRKRRD
jgi:hypothetical protein